MQNQLQITATLIQETLEFDLFGMKIPDYFVENLIQGLPQCSQYFLSQIEICLNVNPSLYAKRAYRLWASNDLVLANVFADIPQNVTTMSSAA